MVSRRYTQLTESRRLSPNKYSFLNQIRLPQREVQRATHPSRISMTRLRRMLQDFEPISSSPDLYTLFRAAQVSGVVKLSGLNLGVK